MKRKAKEDIEEIDPYQVDKASKVPAWLIILLLKYWAAAAASYFIAIGGQEIGLTFTGDSDDVITVVWGNIRLIVLIGLFMAIFLYIVVRNVTRMLYNRRNNAFRYNMINFKGFLSFFACLFYAMALSVILYFIVVLMSKWGLVPDLFGTGINYGIEPFSYGLYFIVVDGIFVGIKNVIMMIMERRRYKLQLQGE